MTIRMRRSYHRPRNATSAMPTTLRWTRPLSSSIQRCFQSPKTRARFPSHTRKTKLLLRRRNSSGKRNIALACSDRAKLFEKQANRFNPTMKIWDMKLLVGCVEIVVRQAETHHHAGDFQGLLKIVHDGDRSTAADKYGFLFKRVA